MRRYRGEAINEWSETLFRRRLADADAAARKRDSKRGGEPVITSDTRVTIAPAIRHDPRYQLGPDETPPPLFSSRPLGSTLEAA